MTKQEHSKEIYIGEKDLGNYVKALKYRLNEINEAAAVARGTFIRKAVDAVEIVKREESDVKVEDIHTTTEQGENPDGSTYKTSKIRLDLSGEVDLEDSSEETEE